MPNEVVLIFFKSLFVRAKITIVIKTLIENFHNNANKILYYNCPVNIYKITDFNNTFPVYIIL